eukprot:scaffold165661_cov32-Tisochrysis_lutea.AAC.1
MPGDWRRATGDKGGVSSRAGLGGLAAQRGRAECSSRTAPTKGLDQIDECPDPARGQVLELIVRAHPEGSHLNSE